MSRFASKKLKEIDFGDEEVVRIPTALSYAQVIKFTQAKDEDVSKIMLVECIKEWTLKDENGNIPEVNEENILKLDVSTITEISKEISKLMTNDQDKKKSV